MVDNSNIPFENFHSYGNMSSVLPNTLTRSYICCKGENPKSYESIEHQNIEQVLADPLTKRPTAQVDMGFTGSLRFLDY